MTTNKMPTEEAIRALAENVRQTWSLGISSIERERASKSAYEMLLTIADHLSKSKPVAWLHRKDPQRCTTVKVLTEYHPEEWLPVYTTPPADTEDARFYRFLVDEATPNEIEVWIVHMKGDQENYLRKCMAKRDAAMERGP